MEQLFFLLSDSSVVVLVSLVVIAKSICFANAVQHAAQQIHPLLSQRRSAVPSSPEPRTQIETRIRSGSGSLSLRRDRYSVHLHHSSMYDASTCTPLRNSSFAPNRKKAIVNILIPH